MTKETSQQNMDTTPGDKVPVPQKIAYGLGSTNDVWGNWLYSSMVYPVFNIFLMVSPVLVGWVMMITRLVDAVSDPFFGWLSDNTRSKWGRRRPYILVGSILAGLAFPLLFTVGRDWGENAYFWYMIVSFGLVLTVVSVFNMPYQSLGAELTPGYNERTSVYSYRTILQKLPEVGMFFAATFITLSIFNVSVETNEVEVQLLSAAEYEDQLEKELEGESDPEKKKRIQDDQPGFASLWQGDGSAPILENLKEVTLYELGKEHILLALGDGVLGRIPTASLPDPKKVLKKGATGEVKLLGQSRENGTVALSVKTEAPDILRGAQVYSLMVGIIMILVGILVFGVVRERYYDKLVAKSSDRVSIADTIYKSLRSRPFRAQLAMAFSYGLGMSVVGTLGFYATVYYVCGGDVALGAKWNFGMGLSNMVFAVIGVSVYAFVSKRTGKRTAMIAVMISAVSVFLATWVLYNPSVPWLQLLASGLIAFTQAGFWMLYGSMLADVIDYDELECGKRREGAFNACSSWILKVGIAIGMLLGGIVLENTGFDASLATQTDHTLTMIRVFLAGIPIAGLLIALAALARFGLTPAKMAEVRQKLEARRGTV